MTHHAPSLDTPSRDSCTCCCRSRATTPASHSAVSVAQKWRQRWFVLKQSGQIPGQHLLEYYADNAYKKFKGRIDLDECEQVCAPDPRLHVRRVTRAPVIEQRSCLSASVYEAIRGRERESDESEARQCRLEARSQSNK